MNRPTRISRSVAAALAASVLAGAAPGDDPRFSPRLAGATKAFGARPEAVTIWPTDREPTLTVPFTRMPDGTLLARLDAASRAALAADPGVGYVAPQDAMVLPDDPDDVTPPPEATKTFGVKMLPRGDGRGVRIGIIDIGTVNPGAAARAAVVDARSFGDTAPGAHASEVAGLIHRFAPQAQLYVASLPAVGLTSGDVAAAATWLAASGVKIINCSLVTYTNRRDGRSQLDQLVDRLAADGVLWVAAAGNAAQQSWNGPSVDADRDGEVDVPGADGLTLETTGAPVSIAVTWDDWGPRGIPRGRWNVDIVVTRDGREIAAARTPRLWQGEPVETVTLTGPAGRYRIGLPVRGDGRPIMVHVVATGGVRRFDPATPAGSVGSPGTAVAALTVGAVVARSRVAAAAYSGRGPTSDGRAKPELGALGYGTWPRAGTSYAAPRVTAIAARLLEAEPRLGVAALRAAVLAATSPGAGAAPDYINTPD